MRHRASAPRHAGCTTGPAFRANDPDGDDGVRDDTRDVHNSYVDANIQPDVTSPAHT
jgi:hypothetical protein